MGSGNIYAYTLNYKTRKVTERVGRFRGWIMYSGKTWMFDEYDGDRKTGRYLTSLSEYEGVVRGSTVWYFEPSMDKAIKAFEDHAKLMAECYANKGLHSLARC